MSNALIESDLIRATWFGDPGRRKTTQMMDMANHGPVVVFDPEKRLKRGVLKRNGINVENITPYDGPFEYRAVMDFLHALQTDVMADRRPLYGIALDAVTEAQRVFTMAVVDKNVAGAYAKGMELNEWDIEGDDYTAVAEQMRRVFRAIRDIPVHMGLTALLRRDTDKLTGQVRIGPSVSPSVQRDLQAAMDLVLYCNVEEVAGYEEGSALTRAHDQYDCKDAFGVLPRKLIDPTFTRVKAYIDGELTSATDEVQQAAKARRTEGKPTETPPVTPEAEAAAAAAAKNKAPKADASNNTPVSGT